MEKFIKVSTTSTSSIVNGRRMWSRFVTECIVNISHIVNIHVSEREIYMTDNTSFVLTEVSFGELLNIIKLA